jgi:hypothetical protein
LLFQGFLWLYIQLFHRLGAIFGRVPYDTRVWGVELWLCTQLELDMGIVSDRSFRQNQNAHFMFNKFFPEIVTFMRYVKKCSRARQATGDSIIQS